MAQFYLFHGKDTFSLKKKLANLISKFSRNELSLLNMINLDGAKLTENELLKHVGTVPFLASKRLIIIRNFLLENKDNELKKNIAKNLEKYPESSLLIFVEEGAVDKRSILFKTLNKPKHSQEFSDLSEGQAIEWILTKVREIGGNITLPSAVKLQVAVGSDLWRLENTITKLFFYSRAFGKETIDESDIETLVHFQNEPKIFDFTDALIQGNSKKAMLILNCLEDFGLNELQILASIVTSFRTLIIIAEMKGEGMSAQGIANSAGLHPFVVKKMFPIVNNYQKKKLIEAYFTLQEFDYKIKSGGISPKLALDLLVAKICL